jgi:soluble lytic murein transglycosylase-like protein
MNDMLMPCGSQAHPTWRGAAPGRGRRGRFLGVLAFVLGLACFSQAHACWDEAATRYGVNTNLLYAIAKTESNFNPAAINRNKNGSYDIGMMQINSSWLPLLRKYGITENQLYDACTSIHVGAWILAQNIRRLGNSWNAVGAYNAADLQRRQAYALKVYRNLPPEARAAYAAATNAAD